MRIIFSALILIALAVVLLPRARPALACEFEDGYNPRWDSDVIVGGRLVGWEPLGRISPDIEEVAIAMDVDQTFKGSTPSRIEVFAFNRFDEGLDAYLFGYTDCEVFQGLDPTGQYVVLALDESNDGRYIGLDSFFMGVEPMGEKYMQSVERLRGDSFPSIPATIAATLGPLAFLAAAASLYRRRSSG